jgi:hypothetical protein
MKVDLFSVPIFIGNVDLDKIKINNIDFHNQWLSNTQSSHGFDNTLDKESYKYLSKTIGSHLTDNFNYLIEVEITDIWQNNYKKDDFQESHIHTGNHFSFIIYKKVKKCKTIFLHPARNIMQSFYPEHLLDKLFPIGHTPDVNESNIVIFPSFLEHMVAKINNSVTIAGNTVIKKI